MFEGIGYWGGGGLSKRGFSDMSDGALTPNTKAL